MIASIALTLLAGGMPYYLLLERSGKFDSKTILLISGTLLLCAVALTGVVPIQYKGLLTTIALLSALFSIYRAAKTTNFYKLGYHLIFINAPFFILFESFSALYSLSLLVALGGLFIVARFYERNYGSANYHHITGIMLATPYMGTFLTFYLITLALYPPFPNALYFLSYMFHSTPDPLWYGVVIVVFFGNFYLAMRVMTETVFGKPNPNIHYVLMSVREKMTHAAVFATLFILGIYGLKEALL